MRSKKNDLKGMKHVFRFSLKQYFKSKSSYVMFITMFLGTAAAVLLSSMGMERGQEAGTDARMVYVHNESPYVWDYAAPLPDYLDARSSDETLETLLDTLDGEERSVAVDIRFDEDISTWGVTAYTGKDSMVFPGEAETLAAICAQAMDEARYRALGVSEEQIALALSPVGLESLSEKELRESEEAEDEGDFTSRYLLGFACSVLVFMLISFSTSFIVKAVMEEKTSRLVEVLMISVKPLALVAGKILAALILVIVGMAASCLGLLLSRRALVLLGYDSGSTVAGLGEALRSLNASGLLVLLVSVILGYLSYAVMAGISGAACSTVTETDQASGTVMIVSMAGYIAGIATGMVGKNTGMTILSMIPFLSPYVAPARYMNGLLPFWALLAAWILQAAALFLLAKLCSGVYGALIFHRGERVKTKQILKMARGEARS